MSRIIESVLQLSGTAAYSLVGLLAFGEAAAFVGLVLPGELAVLLGGVVASSGQASLPLMIVVASVAAIAGDSVGYEMGRRYGPRVLAWPRFHRRFGARVENASGYLQERGGRAVFLGRWTSVLRALIPGMAGMARMPYRQFLVFNVIGGIAWATTFVLAGYTAGSSWRRVEKIAGRASLLLLAIVVLIVVVRLVTRRLVKHADAVRSWLTLVAATAPVVWARDQFDGPIEWSRARLAPGTSRGLGWTLSLIVAAVSAWIAGIAVQDLFAREELALVDGPVAAWIAAHITPQAASIAEFVTDVIAPPGGLWLVLVLVIVARRLEGWSAVRRVLVAAVLATGLAMSLQAVLPVTTVGTRFPPISVTFVAAVVAVVLPVIARRSFAVAIRVAGGALVLLVVVALAELMSAEAGLSGVVGGLGIGMLLGVGGELTARVAGDVPAASPRRMELAT